MKKKLAIGIGVAVAIVMVAMLAGCVEKEDAPVATPIPTPSPPQQNQNSSAAVKMGVSLEYETHVDLAFYDENSRTIKKFDDGETIVILRNCDKTPKSRGYWFGPIDLLDLQMSDIVPTGEEFSDAIISVYHLGCPPTHCANVVVLLPDGRIANAMFRFHYNETENDIIRDYVSGYNAGEEGRIAGNPLNLPLPDGVYYDGYYDGYKSLTPKYIDADIDDRYQYKIIKLPSTPSKSKSWHNVAVFTERKPDEKILEPFSIQGDIWRVTYSTRKESVGECGFSLHIYPRGESNEIDHLYEDIDLSYYKNTVYILKGKGDYYFKIDAPYIGKCRIEVQDYY